MRQTLVCALGIAILLAACNPAMPTPSDFPTRPPTEIPTVVATAIPTQGHLPNVDWLAYHDDKTGFSVQHPLTWQESDAGGYPV